MEDKITLERIKLLHPSVVNEVEHIYRAQVVPALTGRAICRFAFTLRNVSDGKLSHFVVKEKIAKNKDVSYSIKDLDLNLSSEEEKSFAEYIKSIENKSQTIMSGPISQITNDAELALAAELVGAQLQLITNYLNQNPTSQGRIRFPRGYLGTVSVHSRSYSWIKNNT